MLHTTYQTGNCETADVEELRLRYRRLRRAAERATESGETTVGVLKLIDAAARAGADYLDATYFEGAE